MLPRHRYDLARRFLSIDAQPQVGAPRPVRQLGERQTFWVTNSSDDSVFQVTARLQAIGAHIYIWVDEQAEVNDAAAQRLAATFDQRIYDEVRALWGSEDLPGVDGETRVHVLFAYGLGSGVAGYFSSSNLYPRALVPASNAHEMFFMSLDTLGADIDSFGVESILAHEFQHMIRSHIDNNEDTWMDEGFSTFTELYLGFPNALGAASSFLSSPRTQLNYWTEEGSRAPHYGAAMLFFAYFFEHYGLEMLQTLSTDPASGLTAVENTIGAEATQTLLADWALANYFMLPESGYGYYFLPDIGGAAVLANISAYPYVSEGRAIQQAADYYVLNNLDGAQTLTIHLTTPPEVALIDTTPNGQWMLYSTRADNSESSLTRAFDLRDVSSATLEYSVWYALENLWDYGYVTVSTDGGATWQALATAFTTSANPHGNAYGPGYTGQSFVWLPQRISLDVYAGQEILLRFSVITDDAISQPGMALDDVRIAEIGYSADFEDGDGGWQMQGWIRSDNRLPQQVWVQVAQRVGNAVQVTRWLTPAPNTPLAVPLAAQADDTLLVIFPLAPMTLVPMPYTLRVEIAP